MLGLAAADARAQEPLAFTVAGAFDDLRSRAPIGGPATEARFDELTAISGMPDGGFAVLEQRCRARGGCRDDDDRLFRVDPGGRLRLLMSRRRPAGYHGDGGPSRAAGFGSLADVAAGPRGALYVADDEFCTVRRIDRRGRISTFAGRRGQSVEAGCSNAGDAGPARRARMYPTALATSRRGLLILSLCSIREVRHDGVIRRVAGSGRCRRARDGARARTAPMEPLDVTADRRGRPVFADANGVWVVEAGRLRMLANLPGDVEEIADVLALPDGTVLVAEYGRTLHRAHPGGRIETVIPGLSGPSLSLAFDGDALPVGEPPGAAGSLSLAADGGWLISDLVSVRYVPPPTPRRLAVAFAPASLTPGLPMTVGLEATRAATVSIDVRVRGHRVGATRLDVPAGHSSVVIPGADPQQLNVVRITASTAGARPLVATDRGGALPGGTLPDRVALLVVRADEEFIRSIGGGGQRSACQRPSPQRIDCRVVSMGTCQYVAALQLLPSGILTSRRYAGDSVPCPLTANPVWTDDAAGVRLPTSG